MCQEKESVTSLTTHEFKIGVCKDILSAQKDGIKERKRGGVWLAWSKNSLVPANQRHKTEPNDIEYKA